MKRNFIIIVVVFTIVLLLSCGGKRPVSYESAFEPIDVTVDPFQRNLSGEDKIHKQIKGLDVDITLKAEYKISAMVMSKKKYSDDWTSYLSKYDLALAWGKIPDPEIRKHIKFRQSGRWFHFRIDDTSVVSVDYVYKHSANTHVLHATDNLKNAFRTIKKHQIITLEGYLVWVDGKYKGGNVWWHSSLTRNDKGDGSCEIFYVTKVRIGDDVYE